MSNKKIIFLDIDGVIAPTISDKKNPSNFFSTTSCLLVEKLVSETDSNIVLSSDWRYSWLLEKISERIKSDTGALLEFYDKTPTITECGESDVIHTPIKRGWEIEDWLFSNGVEVGGSDYVILDDLPPSEFECLSKRLVNTNPNIGFTNDDYIKALEMLS